MAKDVDFPVYSFDEILHHKVELPLYFHPLPLFREYLSLRDTLNGNCSKSQLPIDVFYAYDNLNSQRAFPSLWTSFSIELICSFVK